MWGSDKKSARHNYDTLISSKTEIVGDFKFTGGLHIDGCIKGSVEALENDNAVVRISDHGVVEGEVKAPHVIINGQVIGNVYSSKHVELAANASVTGTVHYHLLEMVMGAQVNGNLVHQVESQVSGKTNTVQLGIAPQNPSVEPPGQAKSKPLANS
ncbi:MAG: polymer-forming cytoskeletal protein [Pseudomonadales bacterium]|nr:polymer-forming cytoskeletal protein [Pseudomonadales bacterium]